MQAHRIPDPESFRQWLRAALDELQLPPTALSRELFLGKNTLLDFLAGPPGRDIRLGTAAQLERALTPRLAAKRRHAAAGDPDRSGDRP
ncbi:MAG: hypothetical protein ACU0AT_13205 [Tranquillimonas sp.]